MSELSLEVYSIRGAVLKLWPYCYPTYIDTQQNKMVLATILLKTPNTAPGGDPREATAASLHFFFKAYNAFLKMYRFIFRVACIL